MDKRLIGIIVVIIVVALSAVVYGVDEKDDDTPPWMEHITVNGRDTYLVPKGVKRDKIGSQVVVEPPNEYVARRIYEIERDLKERFKAIEDNYKSLTDEIRLIKVDLAETRKILETMSGNDIDQEQ